MKLSLLILNFKISLFQIFQNIHRNCDEVSQSPIWIHVTSTVDI
jgi:hypothetical protein